MHLPISSKAPRSAWIALGAVALFAAFAPQQVSAQAAFASSADVEDVTFTRDVAPIIQQNCQVCHRPGGIGPMDLVTYDDARRYARRIREQVANRLMPPYYYDNDIGIQALQHDWRLSEEDIATVVSWVDQGAIEGDPADLTVVDLPDTEAWSLESTLGPPDIVVASSAIDVPAEGGDMWHRPFVATGIPADRCIRAMQVKPRGEAKAVVHHANSTFQTLLENGSFRQAGRATEYAMGKLGELIPDGVCRTIPADAYVAWDIHLYPGGLGAAAPNAVIEGNQVDLGIWLQPADYEYEYRQNLSLYRMSEGELVLKPNSTQMVQGFHSFNHPVRIDSFQPHGHLRLRSASLEIFYPKTGRTEMVSMISNWSATWHQSHIYETDVAPLIPAGAVIVLKQWYDNTAGNPNNPDPDQWVDYGNRTADEMNHAWIAITHLDEEGYEELLAERETEPRNVTDQD
jgi:mono/diheme cytochrome c family protein